MKRSMKWPLLWAVGLVVGGPLAAQNVQLNLSPQGGEYAIAGTLPGDQMRPQAAVNASGGLVVWQDNAIDGDGLGIGAQVLDSSFSGTLASFRVNQIGAGDQENPQVTLLKNGGAAIVWQGGTPGFQKIFVRFLTVSNTFVAPEVMVNTFTNDFQVDPVITSLPDGNVMVAWSSFGQDGDMQGIFARRLSATGAALGDEFQVNQFSAYNQRNSAVATLANGNVVVAWISEQQTGALRVDVFARLFKPTGEPVTDEFLVDTVTTRTNICSQPSVAGGADGGFVVAWAQKDFSQPANGWDVFTRPFDANANALSDAVLANTYVLNDQYAPKVASLASNYLIVWTSFAQDGDRQGVYGQFFAGGPTGLQPVGNELPVNTTTISQQLYPTVASDGVSRFLTIWSSFVGGPGSFDLYGQRFTLGQPLPQPAAPFVTALGTHQLGVTWPWLAGFAVDHYQVMMDGATAAASITNNQWTADNLAVSSTHTFRLAFQLANGQQSAWSDPASGTTWGTTRNDGVPFDWLIKYYGNDPANWPAANADTDGDGANTLAEFLAGTDPTNSSSVLRTSLSSSNQGWRLNWNTQPGFIYQVQSSADLNTWTNLGAPRFAPGPTDSVPVPSRGSGAAYYRIICLR